MQPQSCRTTIPQRRFRAARFALACWPFLLLLLAQPAAADTMTAAVDDATLRDVTFVDADRGWAVGDLGVILKTDDGGLTWSPQQSDTLGHLDSVAMFNSKRGLVVGGAYEPHTRIGRGIVLWTADGGDSWQPTESIGLPPLTTLLIGPGGTCIAAGAWSEALGSNIFRSLDGGRRWEPVEALSTATIVALIGSVDDYRQVTASDHDASQIAATSTRYDDELWTVSHASSELVRQQLPSGPRQTSRISSSIVRGLFRLDQDRGWAVGEWGSVSVTRDGGRTWRTTRGAERRVAVMAISNQGHRLPWSLLALESQQFRRRVALVTNEDEPLVREAARLLGPTSVIRWSSTDSDKLSDTTAGSRKAVAGDEIDAILKSSAPAVLVLSGDLSPTAHAAWIAAAARHGVPRVFETEAAQGLAIRQATPMTATGQLAGDVAIDAWMLLQPGQLPADDLRIRVRQDSTSTSQSIEGIAGFLANDKRYLRSASLPPVRRHYQVLQARTGETGWVRSIAESATPLDPVLTQVDAALARTPPENRRRLIYRLIIEAKRRQNRELYRSLLDQAGQSWPNEPLALVCDLHHRRIQSSEEWNRVARSRLDLAAIANDRRSPTAADVSQSVRWSPFDSPSSQTPVRGIVRPLPTFPPTLASRSSAGAIPNASDDVDDSLDSSSEPDGGIALASATESIQDHEADIHWQAHPVVRGLRQRRRDQGEQTTIGRIVAPWVRQRPLLDANLDETDWRAAIDLPLGGDRLRVAVAHDADFFYVAFDGPALTSAIENRPADTSPRRDRQRDADLDTTDRYVVRIDVDGDFLTAFELEFDADAVTRDSCDGFLDWQPKWFVATKQAGHRQRAEIAIQKSDLIGHFQDQQSSWMISISRRNAGQVAPAIELPDVAKLRIIDFE